MIVLVTGATGFVGRHLVQRLDEEGHDVYSLVRSQKKFNQCQLPGQAIIGDLSPHSIDTILPQLPEGPKTIIHTAGIVHSHHKKDFAAINFQGTKNLAQALKKKYDQLHFIFLSSLAAAGPETQRGIHLGPVSSYGYSKLQAENFLQEWAPPNWQLSILRPPMVIGPKDQAMLDVFKMVQKGKVPVCGQAGKHSLYNFICVFDLVEIIINCLDKPLGKTPYFTASDEVVSFTELTNTMAKTMGLKRPLLLPVPRTLLKLATVLIGLAARVFPLNIRLTPDKYHEIIQNKWTCDGGPISEALSYSYNWTLEKTIKVTVQDYQSTNSI